MSSLSSSRGRFNEIMDPVERGEYAHAEGLCRALLQKYSGDVNVLGHVLLELAVGLKRPMC